MDRTRENQNSTKDGWRRTDREFSTASGLVLEEAAGIQTPEKRGAVLTVSDASVSGPRTGQAPRWADRIRPIAAV